MAAMTSKTGSRQGTLPLGVPNPQRRVGDDYSQLVALNRAMELRGTALKNALDPLIDVNQWMRTFAMMSLNGTDDIYSRIWEHNFRFYVRPTDNKIIVLQWDLDRSFQLSAGASIPPTSGSVVKLFSIPQYRRLFDGHLDDLIDTTSTRTTRPAGQATSPLQPDTHRMDSWAM